MAIQTLRSQSSFPTLSALDQQTLALLMSLKNNPDVLKDETLLKMFNNAVSFMTAPGFSTIILPTGSIAQPLAMPPASAPPASSLVPFIQIDTSGEDGDSGCPAPASSGIGINGPEGSEGGNAHDIHLQLATNDETITAQWDNGSASMKLKDSSTSIFLRAIGGRGGRGGDGGRGGAGAQGARGRDADRYSHGKDGERGGSGRPGGDGGEGGSGGKGGDIKVYVSPENADLLMLLKTPDVTGGARGKGGCKGKGGMGGKGGEGGSGHHFSVMKTGTRTVYHSTGTVESKRHGGRSSHTETYTYSAPDYNPGGSNGPRGLDGEDGRAGTDGKAGLNGSFQMIVGGTGYPSLYDLAITVSKIVDLTSGNPADIYEPGERVNLRVSAINTGGMPTPSQDIDISFRPAPWLEPSTSTLVLAASEPLPIEGSRTLSASFSFSVKEQDALFEEPLNKQEFLTYQAVLRRINRPFPRVSQQKDLFPVRYPVQISPLNGKVLAAFDEQNLLSLFIQNISSICMGKAGPQNRSVFATFEITQLENARSNDIEFLKTSERDLQEHNKVTVEVNELAPKSEQKLAVHLRFTNPDLRSHSKVLVVASLHLGYLNSKNSEQLGLTRCIQKRNIHIEFREKNQPNPREVTDHPLS